MHVRRLKHIFAKYVVGQYATYFDTKFYLVFSFDTVVKEINCFFIFYHAEWSKVTERVVGVDVWDGLRRFESELRS